MLILINVNCARCSTLLGNVTTLLPSIRAEEVSDCRIKHHCRLCPSRYVRRFSLVCLGCAKLNVAGDAPSMQLVKFSQDVAA